MKIAYVVTRSDTIGGSHIHIRDMAEAVRERGDDVTVLVGGAGPFTDQLQSLGIRYQIVSNLRRNISPLRDCFAYVELKQVLSDLGPDLVSTHSSKAGFIGRLACVKLGLPVLFTAHGWPFSGERPGVVQKLRAWFYRFLEKKIAPHTDRIITVSDHDRSLALNHFSLPETDVVTIPNGMHDIPEEYRAVQTGQPPVQIVMIARFEKQKDHAELLEAVKDLQEIHLHFVGEGPYSGRIRRLADRLGMNGRVTFWGRLDDVREMLSKSHIFALISNWEGFPRSTLEAMRAGLPVVVSDVGGAAEAVVDGTTGFVVDKGDVKTLRNRIERLAGDTELRSSMGKEGRKRFEKNYTFDTMYRETLKVYRELTEGRSRSPHSERD